VNGWHDQPVQFKYQLSDWTLFRVALPLKSRSIGPFDSSMCEAKLPIADPSPGCAGFVLRGLPIEQSLPALSEVDGYIRYVPLQYDHCYIDLSLSFDAYQRKFSSKTRSTLKRKMQKFAEHCGGKLQWRSYKHKNEMAEFHRLARSISKLTYQERLLDAGIPDTPDFVEQAQKLAELNQVRSYILFDNSRPVSYLYCPVQDLVVIYAYLGYDPEYRQLSVGTILQWLALEELFGERVFRYFDFTEGQSEHKKLFATHTIRCANVFFLRKTLKARCVVRTHHAMNAFVGRLGAELDRLGTKAKVRRILRFAR